MRPFGFCAVLGEMQDSLAAAVCNNIVAMNGGTHLATWVSLETKQRFTAAARCQGLSDSALLKRLVELTLRTASAAGDLELAPVARQVAPTARLTIRLRPDDLLLIRERAAARGMPAATYVSVLVRAHLRRLAPLPKAELLGLKRAVAELGSVGRNLNQIAKAAHRGDRGSGASRDDVKALLTVCGGLRDHIKGLLAANFRSWEQGYDDGP